MPKFSEIIGFHLSCRKAIPNLYGFPSLLPWKNLVCLLLCQVLETIRVTGLNCLLFYFILAFLQNNGHDMSIFQITSSSSRTFFFAYGEDDNVSQRELAQLSCVEPAKVPSDYSQVPNISMVLINVTGLIFEIVRYVYLKTKGKFSNFLFLL